MKNRNLKADDNWITPRSIYDLLDAEFNFDFDPCPYNEGKITLDKNGLLIPWGQSNFINPPYSKKLKDAFVKRAYKESRSGKCCVLLLPVSTSTKLFHAWIKPHAKEIRFIEGRIKFQKKDASGKVYTPKNGPMHDSMIVIF